MHRLQQHQGMHMLPPSVVGLRLPKGLVGVQELLQKREIWKVGILRNEQGLGPYLCILVWFVTTAVVGK